MSLPNITITGGVCSEVELRFTSSGKAVANFRVAANDRKKTDNGGWVDGDSCYLTVNIWERKAEAVAELVSKGSQVVVTGKLRQRDYETKDGEKRSVYEVQAYDVALVVKSATADREKPTQPPSEDPWAVAPAEQTDPWAAKPGESTEVPF